MYSEFEKTAPTNGLGSGDALLGGCFVEDPNTAERPLDDDVAALFILIHIDPVSVRGNEFPNAQGDAHNIYHIIASLLFVTASITFFAGRIEDTKS